jgi:uncharacterized delta-60 repeat protein
MWKRSTGFTVLVAIAGCAQSSSGESEGASETSSGDSSTEGGEAYFVSSKFVGLEGTGLRLRAGQDELEVVSLVRHTFPTAREPGDPYEVEIVAQPRWPAQTCQVMDAGGVIVSADVEVIVQCTNDAAAGLDPGYGDAGLVVLDDFTGVGDSPDVPFDVSMAPDGGVVVAGQALSANEFDGVVWRLQPDGAADTSFGDDGLVLYDEMVFETFVAAEVAGDGSVYATGRRFVPMAGADLIVVHYLADGTLDPDFGDPNFGGGGSVRYDNLLGGCPDQFVPDNSLDLALTPAGVLIAGSTSEPDCDDTDAFVVRLDAGTGAIDPTYGENGVFSGQAIGVNPNARNEIGAAMAVRPDNSIWLVGINTAAVGSDQESALIWSVGADGALDLGFGDGGHAQLSQTGSTHAWAVARALDGSALIAGELHDEGTTVGIWQVLGSGALDPSFADAGMLWLTNDGRSITSRRIAVDSAGRIIVLGTRNNLSDEADVAVWRFDPNGEPDLGFADAGLFVWDGGARDVGFGLTLDASDRIIVSASRVDPDDDVAIIVLRIDDP